MSFFPIHRYRLFNDPFDRFFGDQLDFFDPWRDFDTFPAALSIRPNAFRWINEPLRLTNNRTAQPTSPGLHAEKFRVQLNVAGFNPESIKTKVEGRKVIVEAKQEDRLPDGDFHTRELRKSYELPEHAGNNQKQLELTVGMKDYKPQEIKVSVKNNELIVQGEHRHKDENRSERSFFFKSTTLPPGTQIDQLQSHLTDDGQLKIEAPFVEQKETVRSIEVEKKISVTTSLKLLQLAALTIQPNAFRWINEPLRLTHHHHRNNHPTSTRPHAEKFRVQLNVAGFNPESIKTKVEGRKVIVEAKQEDRQPDGDFHTRELRKSYELPEHADAAHLASYVTPNNMLVIEVPIKNPEAERRLQQAGDNTQRLAQFGLYRDPFFDYTGFLGGSDFQPVIVDKGNNQKQLELTVGMKDYKPQEIKVSVKNNELIVQGEHRHKDENRSERSFFFKSTTLPPGTQIDQLQSHLTDDGQLKIEAPFVEQKATPKPIEVEKQEGGK
ncbi:unnamed protein product [Rotaria magnacalcarata]|uniref:SHSP domain-containing protein n=1 Tax=Rotaria magnacalcarata TaxID=392030 RepID=A0A815ZVU5_9BILA|nr:unnamed protein product [Rotaria magnacalcarata]